MSFDRGWRQRRAAAQARADWAKNGTNPYREYSQRQRENDRRALQGLPPLTDEPKQQRETPERAKARRERDAIIIPNSPDDLDDDVPLNIDKRKLN